MDGGGEAGGASYRDEKVRVGSRAPKEESIGTVAIHDPVPLSCTSHTSNLSVYYNLYCSSRSLSFQSKEIFKISSSTFPV